MIPLMMKGSPASLMMAFISSTDLLPAGGTKFFRKGSPAASTSMATAKAPDCFTSSIFSEIIWAFQGFTVGTPTPPQALMASVAPCITWGSIPSPVKAAMPASAHPGTSSAL